MTLPSPETGFKMNWWGASLLPLEICAGVSRNIPYRTEGRTNQRGELLDEFLVRQPCQALAVGVKVNRERF